MDMTEREGEHEIHIVLLVSMCVQALRAALGAGCFSALIQSACLHGACCHTRSLFRKSLGLFIPPPAWAPAKERQALVYLLVHATVYGFPAAVQPEAQTHGYMHIHRYHMGVGDHVGLL